MGLGSLQEGDAGEWGLGGGEGVMIGCPGNLQHSCLVNETAAWAVAATGFNGPLMTLFCRAAKKQVEDTVMIFSSVCPLPPTSLHPPPTQPHLALTELVKAVRQFPPPPPPPTSIPCPPSPVTANEWKES